MATLQSHTRIRILLATTYSYSYYIFACFQNTGTRLCFQLVTTHSVENRDEQKHRLTAHISFQTECNAARDELPGPRDAAATSPAAATTTPATAAAATVTASADRHGQALGQRNASSLHQIRLPQRRHTQPGLGERVLQQRVRR